MRKSLNEFSKAFGKWWWVVVIDYGFGIVGVYQTVTVTNTLSQIGWGILLFCAFALPPFIAFHRMRMKRDELIERAKFSLKIKESCESNYRNGQKWGLEIYNEEDVEANNCEGLLLEIEFTYPQHDLSLSRWPSCQRLRLDDTIPCKGTKLLDIAYWVPVTLDTSRLQLAYEDQSSRERYDISDSNGDLLLVISVSSRNTRPNYAILRLIKRKSLAWGYDLVILAKNLSIQPSVKDYQQPNSGKAISPLNEPPNRIPE